MSEEGQGRCHSVSEGLGHAGSCGDEHQSGQTGPKSGIDAEVVNNTKVDIGVKVFVTSSSDMPSCKNQRSRTTM